jgi:transcription elongation factor
VRVSINASILAYASTSGHASKGRFKQFRMNRASSSVGASEELSISRSPRVEAGGDTPTPNGHGRHQGNERNSGHGGSNWGRGGVGADGSGSGGGGSERIRGLNYTEDEAKEVCNFIINSSDRYASSLLLERQPKN